MDASEKRIVDPPHQRAAADSWLRREVVPVAIAMQAKPWRGLTADELFNDIRALHAERLKARHE